MKVTLNWLKQYVDFDWSSEELAERLTMLGIEVEGIEKLGGEFDGIVVAQVVARDKHPNADKLSVCRVNDGKTERQVVCGAQNFKAGDKVALILPGHTLPARPGEEPFAIKVGKIRNVESQGMMCSPKELGLAEDAQGLLILPEDARVASPLPSTWAAPAATWFMTWKSPPTGPTSTASSASPARSAPCPATRCACLKSRPWNPGSRPGPGHSSGGPARRAS